MEDKLLTGKKVAIIVTDDYEQAELLEPRKALDEAGAQTFVVSPHLGEVQGMNHDQFGEKVKVDMTLEEADPQFFDAILLPGGALNADKLRVDPNAQEFVKLFDAERKPIAIICHAPWLLVSAKLVEGRHLTSYHTIQDDIRNAGGLWEDKEIIVNGNWVTSRKPDDIPAFNTAMIELFSQSLGLQAQAAF